MNQEHPQPTSPAAEQPSPAAQFQFRFERFSAFVEEFTSTISLEGMFLKTREPRPVGTVVAFDIRLADGFQLIHGQGEVVWMRPDGQEQPGGMGIRFQRLSDKGRELILKILEEHLKAGGQPFEVTDIPAGVVSSSAHGGAGAAPGGLDFDAPWGAKLPDVPAEFLDEGAAAAAPPPVDRAPSPPLDDVFELPPDDAFPAAPEDLFAEPEEEALPDDEPDDEDLEYEAVPEFDAGMGEDAAGFDAGAGFTDSGSVADWDIQPLDDEEPTLLGANDGEPTLLGEDEPTLVSLSAGESSGGSGAIALGPPASKGSLPPEEVPAARGTVGGSGAIALGPPVSKDVPPNDPPAAAHGAFEGGGAIALGPPAAKKPPPPEEASSVASEVPGGSGAIALGPPAAKPPKEEVPSVASGTPAGAGAIALGPPASKESPPPDDLPAALPRSPERSVASTLEAPANRESPRTNDLPTYGQEELTDGPDFSEVAADNPFAAEPVPSALAVPTVEPLSPGLEVVKPTQEEAGGAGVRTWDLPEPVPEAVVEPAPGEAAVAATASVEEAIDDPLATDAFEVENLPVPEARPQVAEAGGAAPPGGAGFFGTALVPEPPADGGLRPVEPGRPEFATPSPGVTEGGLIGPFSFEDYDLDEKPRRGGALKRLRKPLLGLAALAALVLVVMLARGPILEWTGFGEPEPVAIVGGPQGVPEPGGEQLPRSEQVPTEPAPLAQGPVAAAGAVGAVDLDTKALDLDTEAPDTARMETSSGEGSPQEEAETGPEGGALDSPLPPAVAGTPPPPPPARSAPPPLETRETYRPPPVGISSAEKVLNISARAVGEGTLVTVLLDGEVGAGRVQVDEMVWTPVKAQLLLSGILEAYDPQELTVNTTELKKIRTGLHSGGELRMVFDFPAASEVEPPRILNDRIEILIRRR